MLYESSKCYDIPHVFSARIVPECYARFYRCGTTRRLRTLVHSWLLAPFPGTVATYQLLLQPLIRCSDMSRCINILQNYPPTVEITLLFFERTLYFYMFKGKAIMPLWSLYHESYIIILSWDAKSMPNMPKWFPTIRERLFVIFDTLRLYLEGG